MRKKLSHILLALCLHSVLQADNQTPTVSPILPESSLPFRIEIQQAPFSLPAGLHSYTQAAYGGKVLLIAGRTNGLHGFSPGIDNFPPSQQNTSVFVIDAQSQTVTLKSLNDPTSGLTQDQVDLLSVTSPQGHQQGPMLYFTGGYGVNTATGLFDTKPFLTAINIPGLMQWATNPSPGETAAQHIRHVFHPYVQVTGGYLSQATPHSPMLLMLGQNFTGFYNSSSNGAYTQQIRPFRILDNGQSLYILPIAGDAPKPSYRRRDLNVAPIIQSTVNSLQPAYVALSGVFTESGGAWTVPITIYPDGSSFMPDPADPLTFKQGMTNYASPNLGLYSKASGDMYTVILGGISFGFFQSGVFTTDAELPFINQVTTIQIDRNGNSQQYIMSGEYPVILSTGVNPGNQLLFGAGAKFFPVANLPVFSNGVFNLDEIVLGPVLLGYIIGGIQSTLPNTNDRTDSSASPYIFEVFLTAP